MEVAVSCTEVGRLPGADPEDGDVCEACCF